MTDPEFFAAALRRIGLWTAVLAAAGSLAALVLGGWRASSAFALGAAISWVNFHWLKRLVEALGTGGAARPRARSAILFGSRYVLLALGAYVIFRFSSMSLPALLAGIFVAVAAVIAEILCELVYARN